MNKEYMLVKIKKRIERLRNNYLCYVEGKAPDGKKLSSASATVRRSEIKRDICILVLLEQCLRATSAVYIEDPDAVLGFEKLMGEDL